LAGALALGASLWWATPARAAGAAAPDDCADGVLAGAIVNDLRTLFRTQASDGSLTFTGAHRFYAEHPVLATVALDAARWKDDPAFLSQSAAAIGRYYNYLFSTRDRDGNLLLESSARAIHEAHVEVEAPGYNAALALDMMRLARIYVELRRPVRALYWYEGARTIADRVVATCFEPGAGFFFPVRVQERTTVFAYDALSALPLLLPGKVGDNHAAGLIHGYLLKDAPRYPESPSFYVLRPPAAEGADPAARVGASALLRSLLLARVLEASGFADEAAAARARAVAEIDSTTHAAARAVPSRYLACRLREVASPDLHDGADALVILHALALAKRPLQDREIVRLETAVATLAPVVSAGSRAPGADPERMRTAVRDLFRAISLLRERLDDAGLFTGQDAYELSGMDVRAAFTRVLDDAAFVARRAETEAFRLARQEGGLEIAATLLDERAVLGEPIEIKWTLSARAKPVRVEAAEALTNQEVDTLLTPDRAVTLVPGGEPLVVSSSVSVRAERTGVLEPVTAALVVSGSGGLRTRANYFRTVYVERPVDAYVEFPEGRLLEGDAVPIDIRLVKRVPAQRAVRFGWYSGAGLRLREGATFETNMAPEEDTVVVRIHAVVPSPCRPGAFAFKMKFYAATGDLGTVSSALFRPYRWLFVGPFPAADGGLRTTFPPERSVDLLRSYAGAGRRVVWRELPARAQLSGGAVSVRAVMDAPGVGYLYTVVGVDYAVAAPVFLSSNVPAEARVNGEVVVGAAPGAAEPSYGRVQLKEGLNDVLIKFHGDAHAEIFFDLGDEHAIAPDEFANDLAELIDEYREFRMRSAKEDFVEGEEAQRLVTLRYVDETARSVSVIGSFNGWSPDHSRMRKLGDDVWELTISLPPGKYAYRFLIDNRRQVLDPAGVLTEPDGYGGKNSVIVVGQ
jgi:hypothetical protein